MGLFMHTLGARGDKAKKLSKFPLISPLGRKIAPCFGLGFRRLFPVSARNRVLAGAKHAISAIYRQFQHWLGFHLRNVEFSRHSQRPLPYSASAALTLGAKRQSILRDLRFLFPGLSEERPTRHESRQQKGSKPRIVVQGNSRGEFIQTRSNQQRLSPAQARGIQHRCQGYGGETGIRTLETVSRLHTFQACAFDHSATSPLRGLLKDQPGNCKG